MAEAMLLHMVRGLAGKAANEIVHHVTRMCGVDDDREKLRLHLLAVESTLRDAELKSETDPAIKSWMKCLKAVAYEADEVLDDFHYEALRRDAQIGDSTTRKVLGYFTPHNPLLFRLTLSKKLSNVLKKINGLVEQMNMFGLVKLKHAEAPRLPYRETHSALEESTDILGRQNDKRMVVKLLLDQREEHKLQVFSIVGMGGLGKTTLAKMVYNDTRVQEHFQLKMWHCVSDNFEAVSLLKSVIELATKKRCELPLTIEVLREELQKIIGRKRFLLVLDDVWNEDKKKWENDLKPLLSSVGGHGSVVVVTTRSQRVASIMGTLGSHELACLNADDSWDLFSKKAFGKEVREQVELVTIGKLIVKKCRGLPLALNTMGGMMSSMKLVSEWETIAGSNIGDSVKGKHEILPILKLSYRHLPSEMKQCFTFCSVFPKDYEMDKEVLIQLWMANGFIQEEATMSLEQKGEKIFDGLVWRSFLQDVKAKSVHYNSTYESIGCKMHDLMHDLAKDVADDCASSEHLTKQEASTKSVQHMHIEVSSGTVSVRQQMRFFKGSSLRTLIMPPLLHEDLKDLRLVSLRALGVAEFLNSTYTMQSYVINAKHLRYLDLSLSQIVMLPSTICGMYNLQTLRLNGCCGLKYLPEGLGTMKKLVHLYLLECRSLERMPSNIGRLNNLRTLTTFVLDTEAGRGIEELKDLRHIANRLELYNLRKINNRRNGQEANLHQKENLRELLMYWGRDEFYIPENQACNEEEVLDTLMPPRNIKVLGLHGYSATKIPKWMGDPHMLQCITTLEMSNCPGCKNLSTMWLLFSLERLLLSDMDNLTTLCKEIGVEAEGYNIHQQIFPKLKHMVLMGLPNLERWAENTAGEVNSLVIFPELEILQIHYCQKLSCVPDCPVLKELEICGRPSLALSSLAHLTKLSKLSYDAEDFAHVSMPLSSWPFLVNLDVKLRGETMATLEVETNQVPLENLRSLLLSGLGCFAATSSVQQKMHLGLWECFAFVEDLCIEKCSDLVRWPTEELRSLIHLRSLSIGSCDSLEGKVSASEEIMSLSHLDKFLIRDCKSLLEIPMILPASLKDLEFSDCPRLVTLPSSIGNLARLKALKLNCCDGLKELPDWMDGLASLEQLDIWGCPQIEKLPQGLLHQLPTLESLTVAGCPGLESRCREGGEYFDLVSSIQCIYIQEDLTEQTEESRSNLKKVVKRLLPSRQLSN